MERLSVQLAICEGNPPINSGFFSQKYPKQTFELTIKLPVIWNVMMLVWRHCNDLPFEKWPVFIHQRSKWTKYISPQWIVEISACCAVKDTKRDDRC